ncbi:MAG: hypothetical protein J3Q66DRAFT_401404 [Benniella sp.]|nr:MAG: hypothetical protein J3Q66DRAFT_401404 [Benniella sp.]
MIENLPVQKDSNGRSYFLAEDIQNAIIHASNEIEPNDGQVPSKNEHHACFHPQGIVSLPDSNESSDMILTESDHRNSLMIMNTLDLLQSQISRLERKLDSKLTDLYELEKTNSEVQDQILSKVSSMLVNTERLLTQTFELHEYTLPRLFIVLPEVAYQGINPATILSRYAHVRFRLYFLCECGDSHTRPLGPHQLNHIHIARHEGYEIRQPKEFFRKYGPHVLRLLQALKIGVRLASGFVLPVLSTMSAMDLPDKLVNDLDHKVMTCISYLTAFQTSIDDSVPELENGGTDITNGMDEEQYQLVPTDDYDNDEDMNDGLDPVSDDIFQIEGADLRRLSSFLKRKDHDRALGNLFRTVNQHGHVKWICMDHYHSTYHQRQDYDFEKEIRHYHGEFDKQLGIVRVNLTSSETIEPFLGAMSRASAFNELDLYMHHYAYHDLKLLGESLSRSNVSKLTLTCHDYRELASMGKRKLYAILKIMAAGKVRYFHFKNIKDLIPARGVDIPQELSTVRSLELTGISLKDGYETFETLLSACTHLAVLRMTDMSLKANHLTSVFNGLAKAHALTTLAFVNCEIEKAGAYKIPALVESLELLRDLDLGHTFLGDSVCREIIMAAGNKLERLSMPNTGFGNESAMALDRNVNGERLKYLDISGNVLASEARAYIIQSMSRLRHCTELMFPSIKEQADNTCATIVRGLNNEKLERLEIEHNDAGDETARAVARMLSDSAHSWTVLNTIKLELPKITLPGAQALGDALHGDCSVAKVSFNDSEVFRHDPSDLSSLRRLFTDICSRLTILELRNTSMSDKVASVLCEALQASDPVCRLVYLDIAENKLTPQGGEMVLKSLHHNRTLETLRIESGSFYKRGSMSSAARRLLEMNRTLRRLTISHVSLEELTLGLLHNEAKLKAIEVQHGDGQVNDIIDLLKPDRNLLRLVIKRTQICHDDRSLEHLAYMLKHNTTLLDLEWECPEGFDVENNVEQRLERNRELWSRDAVGPKAQDLLLALGMAPSTVRAISQGVERSGQ